MEIKAILLLGLEGGLVGDLEGEVEVGLDSEMLVVVVAL